MTRDTYIIGYYGGWVYKLQVQFLTLIRETNLVSNVVLVFLFHINENTLWDPQQELKTLLIINIFMHNTQN